VLADCLVHAVREGAERLVDVATLTGAIVTALGSAHRGLMAATTRGPPRSRPRRGAAGELAWACRCTPSTTSCSRARSPTSSTSTRPGAGSIVAAQFLQRFTGDVPWAHLDIARTAWGVGKPYAPKGGSGFGVRLLVELARRGLTAQGGGCSLPGPAPLRIRAD
jgi:leucyl aminopeptidase